MPDVQRHPEYKIQITVSRTDTDDDEQVQTDTTLAMTSYSAHAPDLEVALPILNEGINERWGQLIEMAGIAEDDTSD